jgi:hypothetical protein
MHRWLAAFALAVPMLASAQRTALSTTPPVPLARAVPDSSASTAMQDALKRLAMAQEQHFARHGTYTTDLSVLGLLPARGDSVFVQVAFAGGRGWTGAATHRAATMRGKRCVMYVGDKAELPVLLRTAANAAPEDEGMAVCDRP